MLIPPAGKVVLLQREQMGFLNTLIGMICLTNFSVQKLAVKGNNLNSLGENWTGFVKSGEVWVFLLVFENFSEIFLSPFTLLSLVAGLVLAFLHHANKCAIIVCF
jgi:hypothetical protein